MAAGLILKFEQTSRDVYDAVNARLGIDMKSGTGDWPAGLLTHAAGTGADGSLTVIEVWESRDAQGRFMQERLGRALAEGGITVQPQVTWIDLFSYHTPGR
ncbi:MAG: hypothetical protein QOI11_1966 [Candidatus Eremiobacteraeota bacterium]|jgi:hypothetical protein|nr:hypothetical protein [Candidatus Eremiobacteraeota bacterium]